MAFLEQTIMGVRVMFLIPFLLSIVIVLIIMWKVFANRIKGWFYQKFKKEKALKIIIHYPTKVFTHKWKLLPDTDTITIDEKDYHFDSLAMIRSKFGFNNEIHYFYNCPTPIQFDVEGKKLQFTGKQLEQLRSNDLFVKLLSLNTEKTLLMMLMIIVLINLVITIVLVLKEFGVLEMAQGG